ncbi:MAG: HWE histidine kinase domain-containing protein [Ahrensia sp.]
MRERKVKDFRLALAGSPVTVFFLSPENRFVWLENLQSVWASADMIGHMLSDAFDDDSYEKLLEALRASAGPDDPRTVIVKTQASTFGSKTPRTLKIVLRRLLNEGGEKRGAICSSIDITEEIKQAEIHRLLMLEVSHRSKNLMAIVLSLAAQTARASQDIKSFMHRFTGRVQSLAKSQDIITETDWTGVSWHHLVRHQVTSIVPLASRRVALDGSDIKLSPNASTHIGLALHELVNRSLTAGTLSRPDGIVQISLEKGNQPGANFAVMRWRETAPSYENCAHSPQDTFSEVLLTRIVPAAVGGSASLEINDDEFAYTLSIQKLDFD